MYTKKVDLRVSPDQVKKLQEITKALSTDKSAFVRNHIDTTYAALVQEKRIATPSVAEIRETS